MSNTQQASKKQLLAGILLLASAGYGLFVAVRFGYRVLASLNSDIAVAIIAAAATIFVSVLSIALGKIYESRLAVQKELRERKIPAYEQLISFMFRVMQGEKFGAAPSEEEMMRFFVEYNQKMMVWGSDSVLAAWGAWRKSLEQNEISEGAELGLTLLKYEELIYAIRKDLGHKNQNLGRGDILRLFVNDLHKINI